MPKYKIKHTIYFAPSLFKRILKFAVTLLLGMVILAGAIAVLAPDAFGELLAALGGA